MVVCRVCGISLSDDNWTVSKQKANSKICAPCEVKRVGEYNKKHRLDYLRRLKDWRTANPERYHEGIRRNQSQYKVMVIEHYSKGTMTCADPFHIHEKPFVILEALTIDHVSGGGTQHRKEVGGHIYRWLINHNYPEGYQVLCGSCQMIKRRRNKEA